jgi:release factor glutamine methyltransferase
MTAETVSGWLARAGAELAAAGIEGARFEARLLLAHALNLRPERLLAEPQTPLASERTAAADRLLARRRARQPMAQIVARREFWSLDFRVTADTLDPRPDSECVVEAALAEVATGDRPLSILDLGTGTGCLLLALLHELPQATGLGVDIDERTLTVAEDNARNLGVGRRARFRQGDWAEGLDQAFDLVVANPPYVASGELDRLAPEVAIWEPRIALDGGRDGLDAYRRIAPSLPRLLRDEQARAVVEVAWDQACAVEGMLAGARLTPRRRARDLGGHERVVIASLRAGGRLKR